MASRRRAPSKPSSRTARSASGKYVYCVIRSDAVSDLDRLGIVADGRQVGTIVYEGLAAVVSDAPIDGSEPTRAARLAHDRVNEIVMRTHTIAPLAFGTSFKTGDEVRALLRSAYAAYADLLAKMDDKLELGLKVHWDRERVVDELEAENEDIRRLKGEIHAQRGSTYLARVQYGRLIDTALHTRSDRYVHEILESLRPVSIASRASRPTGDRIIMNAAFLIGRDKGDEFDGIVRQISARDDKLTFECTGPWPPNNFVLPLGDRSSPRVT